MSIEKEDVTVAQVPTTGEGSVIEIDPEAERKLRLKLDLYILPHICLLYLFCYIDRSNIGNARIAGLEADLNLKGFDYNAILSIFYISYILLEIPGNTLCKFMGPGYFIPACVIGFGSASVATAYVHNFSELAAVRFVLGVFEASMMPANIYYLSRWYKRSELVFRICFFILSASLAGAFGGLLASAILHLESVAGVTRWRMLFFVEATIGVGAIALVTLVDRPESARFLTPKEKKLCEDRIKAERIATTELIDKYTRTKFLMGLCSPVGITTSFIFMLDNITVSGLAFFLPTIVKTIYPEKTVIEQQLRTVPPYVLGTGACLAVCYASWRLDRRNVFITWAAVPSIIGYIIFLVSDKPSIRYAACFLPVLGIFSNGAVPSAQASASVVSDTARLSAVASYAMLGNVGGLISTWAFLPFDSPHYPIGNGLNLAVQVMVFVLGCGIFWWVARDNRKRDLRDADTELAGMTTEEIQDLDWRHPGFRWKI
ncbi:hypothetical protein DV738_g503, partial [Chaetothyriales sp. CBS 135597]